MGESGDRFVYSTFGVYPGSESGPFVTFVVAERSPTGWVSTPVSFPYSIYETEALIYDIAPIFPASFSEDLHTAAWVASVPLTSDGPPEKEFGLYRKTLGQAPEFVAKIGEGPLTYEYPGFVDIASNGGRIVFSTEEHLLPADAGRTSGESIYAWDGGGLQLVDVDGGGALLSTCGAKIPTANGMAASADLVFFTVPATCAGVQKVYVRDLESGTTTEISASHCTRGDCNAPQDATFVTATRNGSAAFLTTAQQLTNDDHDAATDLYRYDVETGELTLLSGGSAEGSGGVRPNVAFPSDNGSRVYFLGNGQLLPGEVTTGEKLFLADSSGPHLVAEAAFPPRPEVQVSADGTRALFVTETQLLPNDTDLESDVYLYDAGQESLTRLSTGPSGGNGLASAFIQSPVEQPSFESMGNVRPFYSIDASGERAFFWTREALVPDDVNGKVDVYEWWEGQLGLISSGQDEFDTGFVGVSRDARSALFVTNGSLLPSDVDGGNRDFYVARLGGGFPEPEQPSSCNATLCPEPTRGPAVRPTLKTLSPPPRTSGRLRVIRIRSKKGAVLGRSTTVLVAVPRPGLVSASVWVRDGGKKVVLATGAAHAAAAGTVRIELKLTPAGRHFSSAHGGKGKLTVRMGSATASKDVKLEVH